MPCATEGIVGAHLFVSVHITAGAAGAEARDFLPDENSYRALLDTGATASGISAKVARRLELSSLRAAPILTAAGKVEAPVYEVNIHPMVVEGGTVYTRHYLNIKVSELPETVGLDVLLGMDVISRGSLHVSGGHFTFCI